MRHPMNILRDRSFPDLQRLPDVDERNRVWARALKDTGSGWLLAVIPAVVSFGCVYSSRTLFSTALDFAMLAAVVFPVVLGSNWYVTFAFRRGLRRSIWRQLRERGMRICVDCGYDLTGNTSGVCSECGSEIKAIAPRPLPKATPPRVQAVAAFLGATGLCLAVFFGISWMFWGFRDKGGISQDVYSVVLIAIAVVVGYLVARRTYRATRKTYRPHTMGFCQQCGDDLTGNILGVCSGCGQEIGG